MNTESVVQSLRDDHKRVTGLFRQLEAVNVRAHPMKSGVIKQLKMELEVHSKLEEEIFYPTLRISIRGMTTREATQALTTLDHALSDHDEISGLLNQLGALDPDDEKVSGLLEDIETAVTSHVEEEERILFPFAEHALRASSEEINRALHERRTELMHQPQYADATPEVVQNRAA